MTTFHPTNDPKHDRADRHFSQKGGRVVLFRHHIFSRKSHRPSLDSKVVVGVATAMAAIGLLAMAACGGRTLTGVTNTNQVRWDAGPDGHVWPDGHVFADGHIRPDGQVLPDANVQCQGDQWSLTQVPIQSVEVLTGQNTRWGAISEGIAIRLHTTVEVGGCDQLAAVTWAQSNNTIDLYATVWTYQGQDLCPEALIVVSTYQAFSNLSPGAWTIEDGSNMTTMGQFRVRPCRNGEDCYCQVWDGIPGEEGASCRYDCQCSYPLQCVVDGMLDPMVGGTCLRTCSTDSGCNPPRGCNLDEQNEPVGVCSIDGHACTNDSDCRPGFSCKPLGDQPNTSWCQPTMETDALDQACHDDCDCPAGYSCAMTHARGGKTCQIKCRGELDCPMNQSLCCGEWHGNEYYPGPNCQQCSYDSAEMERIVPDLDE